MSQPLLILGASARSAAFSALRAGYRPICCDLFADADLQAVAEAKRVIDYPHGLLDACDDVPADVPCIYTGALENSPDLIEQLASRGPLWGNSAKTVIELRDPYRLTWFLRTEGLPVIDICSHRSPPQHGRWLLKPKRGSAGTGIVHWSRTSRAPTSDEYFQEFVDGTPISAALVDHRLFGCTQQLIGPRYGGPTPFAYCGSVGPLSLSGHTVDVIRAIGDLLASTYDLHGPWGIDFILDDAGVPWLTEINPRYTASMELLEHATGRSVFDPQVRTAADPPATTFGKLILYAQRETRVDNLPVEQPAAVDVHQWPSVADIPHTGAVFPAGRPICTLFATGDDPVSCESALLDRAGSIDDEVRAG